MKDNKHEQILLSHFYLNTSRVFTRGNKCICHIVSSGHNIVLRIKGWNLVIYFVNCYYSWGSWVMTPTSSKLSCRNSVRDSGDRRSSPVHPRIYNHTNYTTELEWDRFRTYGSVQNGEQNSSHNICTSMSEETRTKPGPGTETQSPGSGPGSHSESCSEVGLGCGSRLQKNWFFWYVYGG